MNEPLKGYQYIASTLKGYGVTHLFYMESMLRITLREVEQNGLKGILTHTENAAGYMADGYARISGKPGICMAQSIGAANLAGAIHEAWLANSPVIALTGKKEAQFQYKYSYQEADHRLLYESITKFNAEAAQPDQAPFLLRQCFRQAVTGKPGPVHFDMPNHWGRVVEMATINEPVYIEETYKKCPAFRPLAQADKVKEAAKIINGAQRPLIVAGRGAIVSGAGIEIYNLAVKGDIPIATSPDGKTIIDENDSLWAGIVGYYGMECANKAASNADLVIFIGTQASNQTTDVWRSPAQDTQIIHLDIEASDLGRNYPNTVGLLGDAKVVTAQLIEEISKNDHSSWHQQVSGYVKATMDRYEPLLASDSTPIRPERLCAEISKALPDDAVLVADTGFSAVWTAGMIKMRPTQKYLRSAGSLGWAFPASLGVKCAVPERPVVCFAGDGAMYYHLSEMETACRYGINTVTIINNNQALGQCQKDIIELYDGDVESARGKFAFTPVNFCKIAEEFGCFAVRVERPEDIGLAIKNALNANRPAVVEVITETSAFAPEL